RRRGAHDREHHGPDGRLVGRGAAAPEGPAEKLREAETRGDPDGAEKQSDEAPENRLPDRARPEADRREGQPLPLPNDREEQGGQRENRELLRDVLRR